MLHDALQDVLDRRLGPGGPTLRLSQHALAQLRRWVSARHGEGPAGGREPAIGALLSLAGIDAAALEHAEQRLSRGLTHASELGITIEHLGVVGQAYTRSVQRISLTEAEVICAVLAVTPEAERPARLEGLIDDALGISQATFDLLHRAMLREALAERLAAQDTGSAIVAVAHVDVVGSTALLQQASDDTAERLVDGLFNAAQTAVKGRPVTAVKYAGDGVFLAGRGPLDVAAAAVSCIERLDRGFGFQARGGLAYGPVVQRAGDYFGLTVNVSYAMTKAAVPGTLLATAEAAEHLPEAARGRRSSVPVAGVEQAQAAVQVAAETVQAAAPVFAAASE